MSRSFHNFVALYSLPVRVCMFSINTFWERARSMCCCIYNPGGCTYRSVDATRFFWLHYTTDGDTFFIRGKWLNSSMKGEKDLPCSWPLFRVRISCRCFYLCRTPFWKKNCCCSSVCCVCLLFCLLSCNLESCNLLPFSHHYEKTWNILWCYGDRTPSRSRHTLSITYSGKRRLKQGSWAPVGVLSWVIF